MKFESLYFVLIVLVAKLSQKCVLSQNEDKNLICSMVKIKYLKDSHNQNGTDIKCSAVIINRNWLLSPASCLFDFSQPASYIVVDSKEQIFNVKNIIINDNYNNELGAGYDMALVNVDREMTGSGICNAKLIDISSKSFKEDNCKLVKREGDSFVVRPIKVQLTQQCIDRFGSLVNRDLMVCAEGQDAGVCRGQTGAILACGASADNSGDYYLRAISSWGEQNCKRHPYVLTNINYPPYLKWINDTTSINKINN